MLFSHASSLTTSVLSVAIRSEVWTLTEAATNKLATFKMWRIQRIFLVDHINKEDVLLRMKKEYEIII